ncbi:sodium channel protein Nach-like isoform X2 [Artemia franciscana]|uniref:sodium channel protein Nach-like isoform X2 n=1 Tax=Artemia franciscana TaxID=6661 RepID=UPI0032DA0E01
MMPFCRWQNIDFKCSLVFPRHSLTEEGWCCTGKIESSSSILATKLKLSDRPHGRSSGLVIYFDFNFEDYQLQFDYFDGVKILVHQNDEIPKSSSPWVIAPPKAITSISISALRTVASSNVDGLLPSKRFCGFDHEYGFSYGKSNPGTICEVNQLAKKMLKRCGCRPFYMLITSIKMLPCNFSEYTCLAEVIEESRIQSDCLPLCNRTKYSVIIRNTKLVSEGIDVPRMVYVSGRSKYKNLTYNRSNLSILRICFGRPEFDKHIRQIRYSWVDFTSSVGGLLSLSCGFSIISVFECLYLFIKKRQ